MLFVVSKAFFVFLNMPLAMSALSVIVLVIHDYLGNMPKCWTVIGETFVCLTVEVSSQVDDRKVSDYGCA